MPITALDSASEKHVDVKATSQSLHTYQQSLNAGELQQFNRTAGGAITPYSTSFAQTTAVQTVCSSPCIYYGLYVLSSGTGTVNIWDGLSSAGTTWFSAAAPTSANSFMPALGSGSQGLGVLFNTGFSIQQSSTGMLFYPVLVPAV